MEPTFATNGSQALNNDNSLTCGGNEQQQDDPVEIIADPSKYVALPIQNEKIWRKYQTSLDWFWTVAEVNIDNDRASMLEIFSPEQCKYLQKVIAFMDLTHNAIVEKQLFLDLSKHVDIKEATYYFGAQADSKKTHCLMYSLLLNQLTGDVIKTDEIMTEVASIPEVCTAQMWYIEHMQEQSFAKRMLTFATLQGILFHIPFVLFSWIENQYPSKLSGLTKSNQLIWRDERLNLSLSCLLLHEIEDEVTLPEAGQIVRDAVNHAKAIFTQALPVSALGIDVNLMAQFIESSADKLTVELYNEKIYTAATPFDWIVEPKIETNENALTNVITTAATTNASNGDDFEFDDDF